MQNIIFVTTNQYDLDLVQKALPSNLPSFLYEEIEKRLHVIVEGEEYVRFIQDDTLSEYFDEPHEIKALTLLKTKPIFYNVIFKDIEKLKLVLFSVANRADVLIDNDFGIIELGNKFIERCKKISNWDWRLETIDQDS